MAYVKCSGCETMIDIPDELAGDLYGEVKTNDPYYCDSCERTALAAADVDTTEYCHHCGKDIEDFSDLGCEYCDARHPYFGVLA